MIIATVMCLIILIVFVGGTFIWQVKGQEEINSLDRQRLDERFLVEATFSYNHLTETYTVSVHVANTGPIGITLTRVWIIDKANNDRQQIDISYELAIDDVTEISEIGGLIDLLSDPFDLTTTIYKIKIISERGNIEFSTFMHEDKLDAASYKIAIILSDTSYVKLADGSAADIHLEVWNNLDVDIHITLIVVTRMEFGSEHSEIIEVDWILSPRVISIGNFRGVEDVVYQKGEICFIELADITGNIVTSNHFVCE